MPKTEKRTIPETGKHCPFTHTGRMCSDRCATRVGDKCAFNVIAESLAALSYKPTENTGPK